MSANDLLGLLKLVLPSSGALGVFLLVYLFLQPDKFEHWASLFYRFLGFLAQKWGWLSQCIDHRRVAADVQDVVDVVDRRRDVEGGLRRLGHCPDLLGSG